MLFRSSEPVNIFYTYNSQFSPMAVNGYKMYLFILIREDPAVI